MAAAFAALVLVIFTATWLVNYFTTGKITLTATTKGASAKIARYDKGDTPLAEAVSKVSARVKPGRYRLTVFDHSYSTTKVVDIKAKQSLKFSLGLSKPVQPEPVYGKGSSSIAADASQLLFVDSSGRLSRIDSGSNVAVLDVLHSLKAVRWANTSFGITRDTTGSFYTVNAGHLSPLSLPFHSTGGSSVSYDVSPSGVIYLSNGQAVYSNSAGGFRQIYSSGDNYNAGLFAGKKGVAIIEKDSETNKSSLVVVGVDGKTARKNLDLNQAAWSPDGTRVLTRNRSGATILDGSLDEVASIRQSGTDHYLWLNDDKVAYTIGSQLWTYAVGAAQTSQIATLSNQGVIQELSLNHDGSYLYMAGGQAVDENGSKATQLFRIGLKGQAADNSLAALNVFMPETVGICSIDYVNFVRPVITVSYPDLETTPELCVSAAKSELKYYDIDPARFQYRVTATTNDD